MTSSPLASPQADLKTAIVVHAFYPDIADEIFNRVRSLPARHKLFVTTVPEHEAALRSRLQMSGRDFALRSFENRGRDLLPFLRILPEIRAEGFEFVTKVHTKWSPHRLDGDKWRKDLFDKLLNGDSLERALSSFTADPLLGMVGPAGHYLLASAYMGSNETHTMAVGTRLGLTEQQIREHGFFAGTMFTVRVKALEPLLALSFDAEDFEGEVGQRNGTLAHALERGMALSVSASGMRLISSDGADLPPISANYAFTKRLNLLQRLRKAVRPSNVSASSRTLVLKRFLRSKIGIPIVAAVRHPQKPEKRKTYWRNYAFVKKRSKAGRSHKLLKLKAALRHPISSAERRDYRFRKLILPAKMRRDNFNPLVSVVVPNYNHADFLDVRLKSILEQTYKNLEIIILDDCSSDRSLEVIDKYTAAYPRRVRAIVNDKNSGNVFKQWRKGIEAAKGELIWICESDDFCRADFLSHLVKYFADRSVGIAFGRIQFSNRAGKFRPGLDDYREGAEAGIWGGPVVRPAHEWFCRGFGVNNVIANVGGCVFRHQTLEPKIWEEAETFSVLGDWYLYCRLAGGGNIAYDPRAIAYFRQHGRNTSVAAFSRTSFYEEHHRLMSFLRHQWGVPIQTVERFYEKVEWQYKHHSLESEHGPLSNYIDKAALLRQERMRPHILIAFLGFQPGGGELFPIELANALHSAGGLVSMMALDMSETNTEMLASLNSGIPVYEAAWVAEHGVDRFLKEAGISLIHSHMVSLEAFFFERCSISRDTPYVVTLHGSYEACGVSADMLRRMAQRVDHYIYTADKNLVPFGAFSMPAAKFSKLGNAMPVDNRPFPKTRDDLGIPAGAVVFTLVARGIEGKGWGPSVAAFQHLRNSNPGVDMHLLLCGEGPETDRHLAILGSDPDITFLGYQARIHGLYRISDCAIVPTRFPGESFPLCIIQAFQTGTPVIATRIGEIPQMVSPSGEGGAGILIDNEPDDPKFTRSLEAAMESMLSVSARSAFARNAQAFGETYRMDKVASNYTEVYSSLLSKRPSV